MNLKLLLTVFVTIISLSAYGQRRYIIDKNFGIKFPESKIIKFLIEKGEFGDYRNIKELENFVYIAKDLRLYKPALLLIKFHIYSAHCWYYWGILERDSSFLFHYSSNGKDKHDDLFNFLNKYDINTRKVILNYLETHAQADYVGIPMAPPIDTLIVK